MHVFSSVPIVLMSNCFNGCRSSNCLKGDRRTAITALVAAFSLSACVCVGFGVYTYEALLVNNIYC